MHIGIVDDDAPLIENLRFLLQSEPGVQSVRAFASAEELLEACPWPNLDILLVDIELPGLSGVELIAQVAEQQPALSCLAYTFPPSARRSLRPSRPGLLAMCSRAAVSGSWWALFMRSRRVAPR